MICKGFMKPDDICTVDLDGKQLAGKRKRTSEILLHLAIMKHRPDVKAVVHCHPPHATAFAVAREPIPQCVLPEIEVFLGEVPIAPYETPGRPGVRRHGPAVPQEDEHDHPHEPRHGQLRQDARRGLLEDRDPRRLLPHPDPRQAARRQSTTSTSRSRASCSTSRRSSASTTRGSTSRTATCAATAPSATATRKACRRRRPSTPRRRIAGYLKPAGSKEQSGSLDPEAVVKLITDQVMAAMRG